MIVKRYNISKPEKYTAHTPEGGVEKTKWNNIGTLTEFHKEDGSVSRMVEIPAIGLKANCYPFKDQEEESNGGNAGRKVEHTPLGGANTEPVKEKNMVGNTGIEYPEENININDIPF